MSKIITTLFLIFGLAYTGHTQSLKAWLAAADSSFQTEDYYAAMRYYEAALEFDSTQLRPKFMMGESARRVNAYAMAAKAYQKVLESDPRGEQYPEAMFQLANMQQTMGDFANARKSFQAFLGLEKGDAAQKEIAQKRMNDCQWAIENALPNVEKRFGVRNIGPAVNSEYSDFGGYFLEDTLRYSAFKFYGKDPETGQDILFSKQMLSVNNGFGVVDRDTMINKLGMHSAYYTESRDRRKAYFCLCEYEDLERSKMDVRCDIFLRRQSAAGVWSEPIRLDINDDRFTQTEPSVGYLGPEQEETLFFASDRDGGKGGMDIWYAPIRPDGQVDTAFNLEPLNTSYNEVTPFFHSLTQQFYFSTEGFRSMGGYDILRTYYQPDGRWLEPENLGVPVNSSFDDLSYVLNRPGDKGVFATNRWGSTYIDSTKGVCCYDLFEVILDNSLDLDVFTFSGKDSLPLTGVTVSLLELQEDGSTTVVAPPEANLLGNEFTFSLERYKVYIVTGNLRGYSEAMDTIDLRTLSDTVTRIRHDLYLDPIRVNLQAFTFEVLEGGDQPFLDSCTVSLYEIIGTDTILVDRTVKPRGHEYTYSIELNRKYFIKATRPYYLSMEGVLEGTWAEIAERFRDFPVELVLETRDPIPLYFDNAVPDRSSWARTTDKNFADLNQVYYDKKKDFIDNFTASLNEEQAFILTETYNSFFDREIDGSFRQFIKFCDWLLLYLAEGNSIELELRGYASPRGNPDYNERLTSRRINSILNFFNNYQDGAFLPYLDPNNPRLVIRGNALGEDSFGLTSMEKIRELKQAFNIQDSPEARARLEDMSDRKASVYSLGAIIERRVEIIIVATELLSGNNNTQSR